MPEIKELLLPRKKYAEVSRQYEPSPSTFEIQRNDQVLFYFGANHSNDPKNHQYSILREYWKKFLEKTEGKERIALVEGNLRVLANNETEAIEKSSEGGWVTYFAHKEKIPVACPDISSYEFSKIMPDLDKDQLFLTSFLGWFNSYQRKSKQKISLEEICEIMKRNEDLPGVTVTPAHFKALYKQYIGKDFNENESQNDLLDPNRIDFVTNEIERKHSDLREVKIVSEIERYWKKGKNIFVTFGMGHLIIQKPALESLLK